MPARFYLRIYSYLLLRIIYYIRYFDYAYASLNMMDKKAFLTTLNMTGELTKSVFSPVILSVVEESSLNKKSV